MLVESKVTLADVAREAGVSPQTVSRVVNGKSVVRPETRKAVLEVIDRLGYRPNSVARSLVTNRTMSLGLVVPDIGNPYFAEVVRGAEDAARELGYHIFLCNTDQLPEREKTAIRALLEKQVDGIVLCSSRLPDDELKEFFKERQAFVLTGRELVDGAAGSVRPDEHEGVGMAVGHLLGRGRHKIAFLAGWPGGPGHRLRMKAFQHVIESAGLTEEMATAVYCRTNPESGYEATVALLRDRPDIEGLICFNDLIAIGAMRALLERGYRIPEDVAVIGMSDIVLASHVQPSLTTVAQPKRKAGREAISVLVDHLAGREHEAEIVLRPELIIRKSAP